MDSGNDNPTKRPDRRDPESELSDLDRRLFESFQSLTDEISFRQSPSREPDDRSESDSHETADASSESGSNIISYEDFLRARKQREQHLRDESDASGRSRDSTETSGESADEPVPAPADIREATEEIKEEVGSLPDIRADKVRSVQEKIRQGFYERPEILDEVVGNMLARWSGNDKDSKSGGES